MLHPGHQNSGKDTEKDFTKYFRFISNKTLLYHNDIQKRVNRLEKFSYYGKDLVINNKGVRPIKELILLKGR